MSTNLPEKAHAELGASVAHRWMVCHGSVQLSRGRPNFESAHSRAGTCAHHVAYKCLTEKVKAKVYLGSEFEGIEVDEDMVEAVQVYLDYCNALMLYPGARSWPEKQFTLGALNPPGPMYGTSDFPCYIPSVRELHVVDYKNGSGVVVEAKGNKQLRYYALGAVLALEAELGPMDIDQIVLTIVQPRAFHPQGVVRHDHISYVELLEFANELIDAARKTLDPNAPLAAGPHCRFCPASAICPAQRDYTQETAQLVFADADSAPPAPASLTPDALAFILSRLPTLEQWATDIRAHGQRLLETGEVTPEQLGMKLVEKRPTRKWVSESQVESFLKDAKGYAAEEIFTQKLKSPAQIEKVMGKDKKSLPAEFVVKVSSGHTMVPLADKREALVLGAGEVFEALTPGDSE